MAKSKFLFFLPALFMLFFSCPVMAGEINADEQEVIAAASGTFEADGVIYRAKPEYLAELISYLSRDDVDLSADTCQAAIREMYANVTTGIEEGYIYAVKDAEKAEDAVKDGAAGTDQDEEGAAVEKTVPAEEAGEGNALEGTKALPPGGEELEKGASGGEEPKEAERVAPAVPKIFRVLEKMDLDDGSAQAGGGMKLFEASEAGRLTGSGAFQILLFGEMAGLALLVLILLVSLGQRLFGHYRRRRLKKVLRLLLGATTACSVMVLCALVTFRFGLFSCEGAMKQIQKTSFYETVDEELQMNAALALAVMEIPTELLNEAFLSDRAAVAARQQAEAQLKGEGFGADSSAVMEPFRTAVADYLAERYPDSDSVAEGAEKLMDRLERSYEESLQWAGSKWWNREKESFRSFVKTALPMALVLFVGSLLLIAGLSRCRWRAVRLAGIGILSGSAVHLACIVMMRWKLGTVILQLEPAYMGEYMAGSAKRAVFTGLLAGAIGLCTALLWLCAARSLKNGE